MNENFLAAKAQLCEDLLPVTTIFPDAKRRAVDRGSRRRIMTAAKRLGLNSLLRQRSAICLRSRRTPRLARIVNDLPTSENARDDRNTVIYCLCMLTCARHILYTNQERSPMTIGTF